MVPIVDAAALLLRGLIGANTFAAALLKGGGFFVFWGAI
jgi:hypothetical protein